MAHEPFHWVPVTFGFPTLVAADDVVRAVLPALSGMELGVLSIGVRAITSGTATMVLKNAAGTTLASMAVTAAGTSTTTPSPISVASGETLRFGFSGIGVGLLDVSVCQWVKMPSTT